MISQIESILFVASKPLEPAQIAKALGVDSPAVEQAMDELVEKYNREDSGMHILCTDGKYQMATNPENAEVIKNFIRTEVKDELTRAQLESLTVIAYRGPITRPELEQIRGVNCAVIIRNLLIRGLIDEVEDELKAMPAYRLSMDALRFLGISSAKELPEYDNLSAHDYLEAALNNTSDG